MQTILKYLTKSLVILVCVAVSALSGHAATANVTVGSPVDKFTPAVVNINTGDKVIWTWAATFHSTTSGTNGVAGDDNGVPSGLWDSGVISAGLPHTFTNTFNSAGNFPYYCQIHFATPFFMTGAVIVASALLPPTLAITNPASGAVFSASANVTIQAAVTNGSSAVTGVQFLVGLNVLTNVTTTPYSGTTNNLAAGSYTLSAIATDSNGLKATNTSTISVVTPVPLTIGSPARTSSTNFQFNYAANVGLSYVVQRSTNLAPLNWFTLATNLAATSPVIFTDTNATTSPAFYRVGRLPNP